MVILLAVLTGAILGYILERGDFCFHSTMRGLFRLPKQLGLLRAYGLTLLIAIPLVQGIIYLDWIEPWIAPFAWPANIIGGTLFGIGMVVASSCITGLFYKLGHGMLGMLIGLAAWAVGDIITYQGPLSPLRDALNAQQLGVDGESATLINLLGPAAWLLLLLLGIFVAATLWRSPRARRGKLWGWPALGLATGLFTSVAWLLADAGGSDYTFGTSRVPTQLYLALAAGQALWSPWIVVTLFSLIPGALLAAKRSGTLWVRGETNRRYAELAVGGLLMGIAAAIAGGCNLGHSLVGVPLLSMGSITTTLSMLVGVFLADRVAKAFARSRAEPSHATSEAPSERG